jgi:histidinol-phosphate aminotransferase
VAALAAWNAREYYEKISGQIREDRAFLATALAERGFVIPVSHGNFLFARRAGAKKLYEALKERKVLVRYFDNTGISDGVRITIGTRPELEKLLAALDELSG